MDALHITRNFIIARNPALLWIAVMLISACATPESSRAPARVEIQDEVGFTIVEAARINNAVRMDYDQALILLEQGQLEAGISILESVAEAAPELIAPHIDLGIAYHRSGDLEAAESSLLTALDLNPGHPIAHNELGIIFRKSGRFAKARQSYEAALAFYPGYHYARRNLAVLCDLYLADLNCALENYEAYMATVPGDDKASMWISDIRLRLGQKENL